MSELTTIEATAGVVNLMNSMDKVQEIMTKAHGIRKILATAQCVEMIQRSLEADDATRLIKALAGTSLGFRTDKDKQDGTGTTYDIRIVRACVTEAIVRGAHIWGDEFQIIGGNCYLGQRYWRRMCSAIGATDVDCALGLAERGVEHSKTSRGDSNYIMHVSGSAWCTFQGRHVRVDAEDKDGRDLRLAIVSYKGELDTTAGKAKKKLFMRLYEVLESGVSDVPDAPPITAVVEPELETLPEVEAVSTETWLDEADAAESIMVKKAIAGMLENRSPDYLTQVALHAERLRLDKEITQRDYETIVRCMNWAANSQTVSA